MDIETTKTVAGWAGVIGSIFMGGKEVLKFAKEYRNRHKPNLTVRNGEYNHLMSALERIEKRQDSHGRTMGHIARRVTRIEQRLPALIDGDGGDSESSRLG